MDITNITDDMIGKKITCYIYDTFIEDGEIGHDGEYFCILHILQDLQNGRTYKNKEYKYSWGLKHADNPGFNGITKLRLKYPSIELWI